MKTGTIPTPEERLEKLKDVLKNTATEQKMLFDEYIAAGFTADQAMQLLLVMVKGVTS